MKKLQENGFKNIKSIFKIFLKYLQNKLIKRVIYLSIMELVDNIKKCV